MNIFYIDSENIENSWVSLLTEIDQKDEVYVYYTEYSKNINIADIDIIKSFKGKLVTVPVNKGTNALDFQLSSSLGYNICDRDANHIIISEDRGFLPLEEFWKDKANVIVVNDVVSFLQFRDTGKVPSRNKKPSGRIVMVLHDDEERRKVQSILDRSNGYELAAIYLELTKAFGEERGRDIYKVIKSNLRD